ncbi:9688_t:CDS:10 [Diversispora eburnea]|uniref:phenylalanine 4-monooxygenase n=1 Tax=Diversispora eburnea TaxID=1213867 RepID=A0A9N8WQ30_9GLOM|nr:9688_t:CDS:10 [Diversispora eburnea]
MYSEVTHIAEVNGSGPFLTTLLFSVEDRVGILDECLSVLKNLSISLTRIESRPSKTPGWDYDFFVDFNAEDSKQLTRVVEALREVTKQVKIVSTRTSEATEVPWFPQKKSDLDTFANKVLEMGEELDSDHPGAKDQVYRTRRTEITRFAKTYRHGQPIPSVNYTPEEIATWGVVFRNLIEKYPTHACREHQHVFPLLQQNCGYREDNIPQLEIVSKFLKGFTLRPVMGLLSSRDFLNGLAFRVFHSTQYIRHHSKPFYTPEPDICHELLGHVPLFCDPDFADFSQEIGLASLGVSDEDIEKLSTIYWFTVEFGLCRQGDEIRAYGAGLLSSFGELETAYQKYIVTEYQPVNAQQKVRDFANTLKRPYSVRYNPFTESIEVLDKKEKIVRHTQNIKNDMLILVDALERLH